MENLKHDNPHYDKCGFTIQQISEENDRIEIFEALSPANKTSLNHPLQRRQMREELKQKVRMLYRDPMFTVFVMRKHDEFVGFTSLIIDEETKVPTVDHVFIVPRFRKTKALACMLDFGMNQLFPDINIKSNQMMSSGFKKIMLDASQFAGFQLVLQETKDRVKKICNKKAK